MAWYADIQATLETPDAIRPNPSVAGRWDIERQGRRVVVGVDPAGRS